MLRRGDPVLHRLRELVGGHAGVRGRHDCEHALLAAGCHAGHVALEDARRTARFVFHSGCCGASALTRSRANNNWNGTGFSDQSVPSLSKVAMRSAAARSPARLRCVTARRSRRSPSWRAVVPGRQRIGRRRRRGSGWRRRGLRRRRTTARGGEEHPERKNTHLDCLFIGDLFPSSRESTSATDYRGRGGLERDESFRRPCQEARFAHHRAGCMPGQENRDNLHPWRKSVPCFGERPGPEPYNASEVRRARRLPVSFLRQQRLRCAVRVPARSERAPWPGPFCDVPSTAFNAGAIDDIEGLEVVAAGRPAVHLRHVVALPQEAQEAGRKKSKRGKVAPAREAICGLRSDRGDSLRAEIIPDFRPWIIEHVKGLKKAAKYLPTMAG